jgi:hypothetical protein
MEFLSNREEQRFLKIQEAIGKWNKITSSYRIPDLRTLATLAKLSEVHKDEVTFILEGGN